MNLKHRADVELRLQKNMKVCTNGDNKRKRKTNKNN